MTTGSCADSMQMLQSKQSYSLVEIVGSAEMDFDFCFSETSPLESKYLDSMEFSSPIYTLLKISKVLERCNCVKQNRSRSITSEIRDPNEN